MKALPRSVRPVILADRGFRRAGFLARLERHGLDYVVRLSKGSCITEASGRRWKPGEQGLRPGEPRWAEGVRYGLYHGRPRDLMIDVASCRRVPESRARNPRRKQPEEPWYLATSPKKGEKRGLLVLAKGPGRTELQGFEWPVRISRGAGRLPQTP